MLSENSKLRFAEDTVGISSDLKLAVVLAILVFTLPVTVSDGANIHFLYYVSAWNFFWTKFLTSFLIPVLCLLGCIRFSRSREVLRWAFVWFFATGFAFYLTNSLIIASVAALVFVACWSFVQSTLISLSVPLVLATCFVLLYTQDQVFGTFRRLIFKPAQQAANDESLEQNFEFTKFALPSSVYVIVFDELASRVLFQNGKVSNQFPNFKRISESWIFPKRATTNFDLTTPSILTMLRGRIAHSPAKGSKGAKTSYLEPNVFDAFAPENLYVWGWVEPYCNSFKFKGIKAYCLDEHTQLASKSFWTILTLDATRLLHIYVLNAPLALANLVYRELGNLKLFEASPQILNKAEAYLSRAENSMWREQIPRDLERLDDFLEHIGRHSKSFYYFHSALPHFAYLADGELHVHTDTSAIAYWIAKDEKQRSLVDAAYIKNVQAADTVLGKILNHIETRDSDAIIVVTSDHGVARDLSLPTRRPTGHLIPDVVEIPFFLRLPPKHSYFGRSVSNYQHVDFVTTLFDVLEVKSDLSQQGKSIFQEGESEFFHQSADKKFSAYDPS